MSDTQGTLRTIPPTPRRWRSGAFLLWCYLALKSFRIWRERLAVTEPEQARHIGEYIRSGILPSQARKCADLFATTYQHVPVWRVLLPLLIVDLALLLLLYSVAWRLDFRHIFKLRRGITISGPRLHRKVRSFQKAIGRGA